MNPIVSKKRIAEIDKLLNELDKSAMIGFLEKLRKQEERSLENFKIYEHVREVKKQRSEVHARGTKLLRRTNPKGMRGVLIDFGEKVYLRIYSEADREKFKDYDVGWCVDCSIIIDDNSHELKEFEQPDGSVRRVFELAEHALKSCEIQILKPGESKEEESF